MTGVQTCALPIYAWLYIYEKLKEERGFLVGKGPEGHLEERVRGP